MNYLTNGFFRIIVTSLVLTACSSRLSHTELDEVVTIQQVDPLEKVFRETSVFKSCELIAQAARGEHATLQFAIRSQKNISSLNCKAGSLI